MYTNKLKTYLGHWPANSWTLETPDRLPGVFQWFREAKNALLNVFISFLYIVILYSALTI